MTQRGLKKKRTARLGRGIVGVMATTQTLSGAKQSVKRFLKEDRLQTEIVKKITCSGREYYQVKIIDNCSTNFTTFIEENK